MTTWDTLASDQVLQKTAESLTANGMKAMVVENGAAAKAKLLEMLPEGAEVMTMTSVTLDTLGISDEINGSKKYNAVKPKMYALDKATHLMEMQKMGAAPEYTVGSVHAVTENGEVVVASNTGSQLPAYAYGSPHVIWVVGGQKVVKNMDDAMKRLYEYVLPLESERAHKAYGVESSFVSKTLVFHREVNPTRITVILVKEKLGF